MSKTCWDCDNRIGEECDIDGHEVYPDSPICIGFIDVEEEAYQRKDWNDQMKQDQT